MQFIENEADLFDDVSNPLDGIEEIMLNNDWSFTRLSDDKMSVQVAGKQGHYDISFYWDEAHSALQFCCMPDLKIAPNKLGEAAMAMNRLNASLWLGHFDVSAHDNKAAYIPCFRHTSLFRGMHDCSGVGHMEDLLDIAIHECERAYMSFKLLSEVRHTNVKDMSLSLMDVAGTA